MKRFDSVQTSGAGINNLIVSPDGALLAVAFKRTILLVSIAEDAIVQRLDAVSAVNGLAFAPDGTMVVAGSDDGRIRLFNTSDGQVKQRINSQSDGIASVAWSPDGRFIAAGHDQPLATLYDADSGQQLLVLETKIFDESRTGVHFSPDGEIVAATVYNSILLWHLPPTLTDQPTLTRQKVAVRGYAQMMDMAFSPDGDTLAGLADVEGESTLHFWYVETAKKIGHIKLPNYAIRCAWAPDGSFIAVAEIYGDGISLWNPATRKRFKESPAPIDVDELTAVAIHPNSQHLFIGTEEGDVLMTTRENQ